MIYYIIAVIVFLFAFFDISAEKKILAIKTLNHEFFCLLLPVLLICLGGLRWLTGTDWNNYYNFYDWHESWESFNNGEFEFLYTLLNYLCKQISSEYTFFLLVFSFLIVSLKIYSLKKFAISCLGLTVFLLYCYLTGDILPVRQDLALSVIFLTIPKIQEKDKKSFFLITIIAFLIHNSAIIWLFSYPIYWKKINRNRDIILLFVCFLIGFFGYLLYPAIFNLFAKVLPATGRVYGKLIAYTIAKYRPSYISIFGNVCKRVIIFPILFYYEKKCAKNNKYYSGIFSLYIFGTCVYFLFLSSFTVFQRFTNYFLVLECFLLASCFNAMKKINRKIFLVFILFYGLMKLYKALSAFSYVKIPYQTIFNYENRSMDWQGEF